MAARVSGLGEAIEIASLCRWGDEQTVMAHPEDLAGEHWSGVELAGFSTAQRKNRDVWNARLRGTDWLPPSTKVAEMEWVQARRMDGGAVWVPAEAVYVGQREIGDPGAVVVADTNGCAAASTDSASKNAALFELIERDATGRWWYGCRARHNLRASVLDPAGGALLEACRMQDLSPQLFDITTDIGIPVVAAVGGAPARPLALGFGAASTYAAASLDALTEMAQMALIFQGGDDSYARDGLAIWAREATYSTPPLSLGVTPVEDPVEEPALVGNLIQEAGIRLAFFCQTRSEFDIPVWRAISPDLCHWKPRLGRKRLLAMDAQDCAAAQREPNSVLLRV